MAKSSQRVTSRHYAALAKPVQLTALPAAQKPNLPQSGALRARAPSAPCPVDNAAPAALVQPGPEWIDYRPSAAFSKTPSKPPLPSHTAAGGRWFKRREPNRPVPRIARRCVVAGQGRKRPAAIWCIFTIFSSGQFSTQVVIQSWLKSYARDWQLCRLCSLCTPASPFAAPTDRARLTGRLPSRQQRRLEKLLDGFVKGHWPPLRR